MKVIFEEYARTLAIGSLYFFIGIIFIPVPVFASDTFLSINPAIPNLGTRLGDASSRTETAQSFIAPVTGTLDAVGFYLADEESCGCTDNVIIDIREDSGGNPTGTSLDTDTITDPSQNAWATSTVSANVTEGNTYWIRFSRSSAVGTNGVRRSGLSNGSASTYADGHAEVLNVATWETPPQGDVDIVISLAFTTGEEPPEPQPTATTTLAFWCDTSDANTTYCYQHASSTALRTQDAGNITFMLGIIVFYMSVAFCGLLWTQATKA